MGHSENSERLKVILFALTGFGNPVLKALTKDARVDVKAVFTVHYNSPFPYYPERQLIELCAERGIDCYTGVNVNSAAGLEILRENSPDLILMATFKQILKKEVLNLPPLGVVNFHPSLLPRYRGPCPTNAVLYNDEKVTGVSVHYVTEELDEGNILLQRSINIQPADNDGRLREKLARLAGEMVPDLIDMFTQRTKPIGTPQDHEEANIAPRPTIEEGFLELAPDISTICKKVRAFNPIPGTSILLGDRRVAVNRFSWLQEKMPDGIHESEDYIDVSMSTQGIRLFKNREKELSTAGNS